MTRWMILLLMPLFMMSCAKTYDRKAEFIHEEYAPYAGEGTARICGQAYLSVEDGQQHVASGDRVLLAPVTSYTEEAIRVKLSVAGSLSTLFLRPRSLKSIRRRMQRVASVSLACRLENIMWWQTFPSLPRQKSIERAAWLMPKPRSRRMRMCIFS